MVGRKDTSKRVFDTWIEIFQKRKVKRERKSTSGCSSISNEFDFLHSMISNRYRTMLMEKMDILWSWHNKILPHISRHMLTKSFVEDTISLLLHILSPPTLRYKILKIVRASMELFCGGSLPLLRKYPMLSLNDCSDYRCFEGRRWKPRAYTPIEENEIQIKSESASGVYHNVLGFNKYM
ncbi:uncharacterized protein LOC114298158 isoform X3 [Camellia sinensis]|uniref:uncharacterized protein LOC114298158 isoform X3 n=1 Tax=Camellia sinensis TaxID=4442 RepID=UPI0010364281|nr:uncharacterized protein LOC114298158 isoform X3 [Camellia sinensis]XP_028098479.1 uncharacterized protein LOC114298158 isoform X3 [Camellia sinensis]XP_028098480.1 uncharacterized protein LOC114298158 isoform X3 [Camellia sinensis]XP_028098481.1 uncharacterized protein LOC114298158 isoform X3 [Camellia sinensis]